MNKYMVFLKDYEQHKKLICLVSERTEAVGLCIMLNSKCQMATSISDYEELIEFASQNGFTLTNRDIRSVNDYGDVFDYEQVPYTWTIDYSYFDSIYVDYGQFGYDHIDLLGDEWDDINNYEDSLLGSIDNSMLNFSKVNKFINQPTRPKRFDPLVASDHVKNRFAYGDEDELHNYACNHLFKIRHNKLTRRIKKYANRDGGYSIDKIRKQIVDDILYRKCKVYKRVADWIIEEFEQNNVQWDLGKDYMVHEGVIYNVKNAYRYLGWFDGECEICGKIH